MTGNALKIPVGCEHGAVVANAELGEQRVDRSNLNTATTAVISQVRGADVVLSVGNQKRQRRKAIDNRLATSRA